jgi:pyrroline-5-carboxylate reductase
MSLFASIGRVVRIEEGLMDAFTAIAGSGPAYVFYLAEAMMRAGVELGFDAATARDIAAWTVEGSGVLLGASERSAEDLRAAVTSKGGTTAAATAVLDARAVMTTLVEAMRAARDRGAEIARNSARGS